MILNDLISEVSALGFDGRVECDTLFLTSLNRSLHKIFTDKKITSETVLHKSKERISDYRPILHYNGKDQISLPLRGHAVSFYTSGNGSYTIIKGTRAFIYGFSGVSSRHAHRLEDDASKIIFSGDTSYTVSSYAVFEDSYENDAEIPDGRKRRKYDMHTLVRDFSSFASFPRDDSGHPLECVAFDGSLLWVNSEYEGDIHVSYYRLPTVSMSQTPEREIDIPREHEHLLAILLSSYLYLDSNPTLAEHYRELYASMSMKAAVEPTRDTRSHYNDTNGWA